MGTQRIVRPVLAAIMAFGILANGNGSPAGAQEAEQPREREKPAARLTERNWAAGPRRYLVQYKENQRDEVETLCREKGYRIVRELSHRILVCELASREVVFTEAAHTEAVETIRNSKATEAFMLDYPAHVPRSPKTQPPVRAAVRGGIAGVGPPGPQRRILQKGLPLGIGEHPGSPSLERAQNGPASGRGG